MVFQIIESLHRINNDCKEVDLMDTAGLIWVLLPLLGIIAFSILRPLGSVNRKSTVKGLIIATAVYGIYYIWRLTQGGL
jgi:hypothetical protein